MNTEIFPKNNPIPEWLDGLIDTPWNLQNSLILDRWIAYFESEFAGLEVQG